MAKQLGYDLTLELKDDLGSPSEKRLPTGLLDERLLVFMPEKMRVDQSRLHCTFQVGTFQVADDLVFKRFQLARVNRTANSGLGSQ